MFLWIMIQILIESLPISSSGHVMLVQRWYEKMGYVLSYEQIEQVNFLLHGPALIIMLCYFFTKWSEIVLGKKIELHDFINIETYQKVLWPAIFILSIDFITFIIWKSKIFQIQDIHTDFLTVGFFITACILYLTRFLKGSKKITFVWWHAIVMGIGQSISFLPGISRFGMTFFCSRLLGYSNNDSFAFSFLIQFPLVLAAFIQGSFQIYHNELIAYEIFNFWILLGMVPLTYVSYKILEFVGQIIGQNKVWYFSIYMIFPIIISILVV